MYQNPLDKRLTCLSRIWHISNKLKRPTIHPTRQSRKKMETIVSANEEKLILRMARLPRVGFLANGITDSNGARTS